MSYQNIDPNGLNSGEEIRYNYDEQGRLSSVSKGPTTNDGCCWVVTAYYGDPYHEKVCQIRNFRTFLLSSQISNIVEHINNIYIRIGYSPFGKWFSKQAGSKNSFNLLRIVTGVLCKTLLFITTRLNNQIIQNE